MSLLNSTASFAFHELYSGTDFSSLSWFEQQWAAWYIWFGNPVIATGVLAFVVHEVSFQILDVSMSTNSSFFLKNRLFILVVVFHGLSSIQYHTSDDGSCNLIRCLRRKNSGLALCRFYSHILLLNSLWYVTWSSWLARNLRLFLYTIDRAFPSYRWSPWHEYLPRPLPIVEVNATPNILFLRLWGLLPFPR